MLQLHIAPHNCVGPSVFFVHHRSYDMLAPGLYRVHATIATLRSCWSLAIHTRSARVPSSNAALTTVRYAMPCRQELDIAAHRSPMLCYCDEEGCAAWHIL